MYSMIDYSILPSLPIPGTIPKCWSHLDDRRYLLVAANSTLSFRLHTWTVG